MNLPPKIKLHHILFFGFILISAVPVVFLAAWVENSAPEQEVETVAEKTCWSRKT